MKWFRPFAAFFVLLSISWIAASQPSISEGRLLLHTGSQLQTEPLTLSGNWRYIPNRWLDPAELHDASGEWIRVPGGRSETAFGIGTYWLDIIIDDAITTPSALQFHHICGAANVYLIREGSRNNAPVLSAGRIGRDATNEIVSGSNLLATIPPLPAGTYHLLIHESNFHLREGGLCGKVTWGSAPVQAHARTLDIVKNTVIATMLLSLALGSLMLGSQNGERAAPWLALVCVACATLIACNNGLLGFLLPLDSNWRGYLDYIGIFGALIWLPPSLLMVFRHTFTVLLPRWLVFVNLILPILLTCAVAFSLELFIRYPQLITFAWGSQLCVAFAVLVTACKRKRQYAWVALLTCLIVVGTLLYDVYRFFSYGIIEIVLPYAVALLAAVHGGIYTLKFGASYRLAARLSAHLQEEVDLRTRELREKNYNLEQTQNALQRANESLRELSITDGLTRVHNRMYFEQQFEKEWRRCTRHALPLSVLMIDADHFKQLNDSAGHLIGDLCLQSIAREIQKNFKRSGEVVARYGGEEFIVLLPDTNQGKALAAAEGLRTAIEHLAFADDKGTAYRVTVSIGVSTTTPGLDQHPEQLIATADAALYEAKDAGRNRVHSIPIIASRASIAQQKLHL